MKVLISVILFFLFLTPVFGAEPIMKVSLPLEVKNEIVSNNIPSEIEGKVWNRWTSDNFTVLSLNDIQAQYLHKHLELVKVWVYSRWGFNDIPFRAECKMICVDDPKLFEKMFGIKDTLVEIRRDKNGKIQESVIFVLINDSPSRTVPIPLTDVCISELAQTYNQEFPWWANRGMSLLNGSLDQIRFDFKSFHSLVRDKKPVYFSKGLFGITRDEYRDLSKEEKKIFDYCAATMCLMIRKEFGENKFHWFVKTSSDSSEEKALSVVLKFKNIEEFDKTFRRYMVDITNDIVANKTPNSYLQIEKTD